MTERSGVLYFRNRALPDPGEGLMHLDLNNLLLRYADGEGEISDGLIIPGETCLIMADFPLLNRIRMGDIRRLKERHRLPLVLLLANFRESAQVDAFTEGADDIADRSLTPEVMLNLIPRMKNLIARSERNRSTADRVWRAGPHLISRNPGKRLITVDGEEIHLTPTEWNILSLLSDSRGQVVSRETILSRCFEYQYEVYDRSIDAHVKNLRKKVPRSVETVRGVGYRFIGREVSGWEIPSSP